MTGDRAARLRRNHRGEVDSAVLYEAMAAILVFTVVAARAVERSRFGVGLRAIREDEEVAGPGADAGRAANVGHERELTVRSRRHEVIDRACRASQG